MSGRAVRPPSVSKLPPFKPTKEMMRGEARLRRSLRRLVEPGLDVVMPKPTDQWGAWVEYRLDRLEKTQTWQMRIIVGALIAQFVLEILGRL